MFNKDKSQAAGEKNFSTSATLISAGTVVKGDLRSENDLRIDGTIQGNVFSEAKVIVGPTGLIDGNITGVHADISGKVTGAITAKEAVQLRNKAILNGNIQTQNLQIDPGASFNGECNMGAVTNVVKMSEGDAVHAKAK